MSDLDDTEVDDAFVLVRWLHELTEPSPNAAVVASLEDVAEDRGWHPYDAWRALAPVTAATFDPDHHPRGKDGKFIEKLGMIELSGKVAGPGGQQVDATGQRGQVTEIIPDPNDPGNPTIRVKISAPDGSTSFTVDTKPGQVTAAPEKARLDGKPTNAPELAPQREYLRGGHPNAADDLAVATDSGDNRSRGEPKAPPPQQPPPEMLEQEPLGGPNHTNLPEGEAQRLAAQVIAGEPIDVSPPDVDDVVENFADNPDPVDLTLLPQFSAMRGSGRPRSEMPQIPKEHLGTFQEHLRRDGFEFQPDAVDPSELQATQSELDGKNVGGMMRSARDGTFDMLKDPIWVSNDGHVLDGHHRWAAATALSTNCDPPGCVQMPVIRVDMPMSELLTYADRFNDEMGVERLGFGTSRPQGNAPEANAPALSLPDPDLPEVTDIDEAEVRYQAALEQFNKDVAAWQALEQEILDMNIRPSSVDSLDSRTRTHYEGLKRDAATARSFMRNSEAALQRLRPATASGLTAAGTPPVPDANGVFTMVTDTEDGVLDEDLANLPHGDGSAFGAPAAPVEASVTAALRARVHGDRNQ